MTILFELDTNQMVGFLMVWPKAGEVGAARLDAEELAISEHELKLIFKVAARLAAGTVPSAEVLFSTFKSTARSCAVL